MYTVLYVLLVIFLVLANGFFVASEFALVGVRRSRIEIMAASGSQKAQRLLGLLNNLNAYISATQLGITMASLALGWIGEPVIAHILEGPLQGRVSEAALHTISFAIAFTIITFLHIVFGELAPKTLALERAERVSFAIAWPLHAFYKVFQWPIRMLDWAGTRTVRLFGLHPSGDHAAIYTEEELRALMNVSRQSGHIKEEEQTLINRVFDFSEAEVREAMVPRTVVDAIPLSASLEEITGAFRALGYSRLPVFSERIDNVVGVLYRRDLEPYLNQPAPEGFSLEKLLHPPLFVPATAHLGTVLKQMQSTKMHLAVAVDEHGGMEGIVTLEDLLEEIVGEINDEYDEEVRSQIKEDKDSFLLDGMLAVRDANRRFKLQIPDEGSYTTLAGFLLSQGGHLLTVGETIEHEGARFTVERMDRRRIRLIRFTPAPKLDEGSVGQVSLSAFMPFAYPSSEEVGAGSFEWLFLAAGEHMPIIAATFCG
ncbi:MAG: HlyC/CorC family transporter [Acidobacteria bacterium]|nr:HlyC/CorC family transporter [Acidobacteriota bacterium]